MNLQERCFVVFDDVIVINKKNLNTSAGVYEVKQALSIGFHRYTDRDCFNILNHEKAYEYCQHLRETANKIENGMRSLWGTSEPKPE